MHFTPKFLVFTLHCLLLVKIAFSLTRSIFNFKHVYAPFALEFAPLNHTRGNFPHSLSSIPTSFSRA